MLTDVATLFTFDFMESPEDNEAEVTLAVTRDGAWNGVVCWVVFDNDKDSHQPGPDSVPPTTPGDTSDKEPCHGELHTAAPPLWPRGYERPAVQFVPNTAVAADGSSRVSVAASFVAATCEIAWQARIIP